MLVLPLGTSPAGFRGVPSVPDGVITLYSQLDRLSGRQSTVSKQALARARPGPEGFAMYAAMDESGQGDVGLKSFCLYFLADVVSTSVIETRHKVAPFLTASSPFLTA